MLGNHSILLVELEETYLVDLGLGDGPREPIPFKEGKTVQGHFQYSLEKLPDGYWRFHNHEWAVPESYDFDPARPDTELLNQKNQTLQSDPKSEFVQNFVCQIMKSDHVICLTGRVFRTKTRSGTQKSLLSPEQFEEVLADTFGIVDDDTSSLWLSVAARHKVVFGDAKIENIEFDGF